ncbi:MAG: hypothetical protein AB1305_03595 [Candidatus Hadarchaeota archaeon]
MCDIRVLNWRGQDIVVEGGRLDTQTKVVLMFTAAGSAAGAISGVLASSLLAAGVALLFFYLVFRLAPQYLQINPAEFPKKKLVMTGFSAHFVMWLIVWVLVYALKLGR